MTLRCTVADSIDGDAESGQKVGADEVATKEEKHKVLLHLLDSEFGISPSSLEIMRSRIRDSECEKKNGCSGQWQSSTGVVHVVYTSLHNRVMVSIWRWFCFALEAQTTKDFLWIIRVNPEQDLLKELIKPTV